MANSLSTWAARFAPRFERCVPRRIDAAWLERFVDRPRYGWDLDGLEAGFTQPLYRFIEGRPLPSPGEPLAADSRFLRPALACALIAALPGGEALDPLAFEVELTALELHATASTMLDHLDNGRDLAASRGAEREIPLPVLITVAYSARQLAASLLWDHGALPPDRRRQLAQRFSRLLMLQGVGHTLDLWGGEARLRHASAEDLAEHLRWYVAPLDFELACEVAAAAVGLGAEHTDLFVRAGGDIGLAWHCAIAAARVDGDLAASAPPLRWNALAADSLPDALHAIGNRARNAASTTLRRTTPGALRVFEQLLAQTLAHATEAAEVH